jgi:phosphoribosylamine--glycine ligase
LVSVNVLILSMDSVGEGLPLAIRAAKHGHRVRLWLGDEANQTTGDGFKGVDRVRAWLPSVRWSDLVIPTGNHEFMPKLDSLRRAGVRVFGPSQKSAALEIKRAEGMKFFERAGIDVPEYEQFATLADAEKHVRKTERRYVFKTLGDEDDKSLSYASKSPADMVARLQRWQKLGLNPKGAVMLQEFIEGVEFGVSQWMGKDGFIGKPNCNFERKKLMSGDLGPATGEQGTIMKYTDEHKLADEVLYPLEDELIKLGHLGDFDVNCIIDEKGKAWPLEPTSRLGWPAANIMWACHKGDPVKWMADACDGQDTLEVSPQIACGVVLSQPDYPYSAKTKAETDGIPIYGVTDKNQQYIAPQSVKIVPQPVMNGEKLGEKPTWTTSGDYIAVVTGLGKTVTKACERAYETIKELHVADGMYRDDLGEKLEKCIPELQKHGYATEFTY